MMRENEGNNWYALHTRSNFETRVTEGLQGKGLETFLPAVEELHRWKDRKRRVSVPLFPGYVFARLADDPAQRLAVLKTAGVVRILGSGGHMEAVAEHEIAAVHGLVNAKVPCSSHPFLRDGAWVRVTRGPLMGVEGYFLRRASRARLVISVGLICRSVAVEVDAGDVDTAHMPPYKAGTYRSRQQCIQI